jgi:hypothetical protein
MGDDRPTGPTPPIKTVAEVEWLKVEAEEAGKMLQKLEGQQRDALRQYNELEDKIKAAKEKRDKAVATYHSVVPKKLPAEWVHTDMMAAARKQCPGRDEAELKRLVGLLGASQRGALAGEGIAYQKPLPDIEGSGVRNVENHRYDIPAPPRETKSYG